MIGISEARIMHGSAMALAGLGIPVFALRERGKEPRPGSNGVLDATTNLDEVDRLWRRHPRANIGLACGFVFAVLDLDGDEGIATFDSWDAEHGYRPDLSRAIVVATPGAGLHVYYRPTGGQNRVKFAPGCDWRDRGGYVVAPPSVHPNGGRYRWSDWPTHGHLLDAPPFLVGLVRSADRPPGGPPPPPRQIERGDVTRYALAALRHECERVATAPAGTRNSQLNVSALALFQLVDQGELAEHTATEWLTAAAQSAGLGDRETAATLRSAALGARRNPRRPRTKVSA